MKRNVDNTSLSPKQIASDHSLRLSDFSMSLFLPPITATASLDPSNLGTSSYSSPEFLRPAPSFFSFSADIFSLGVTLGVLLTGVEPFTGLRAAQRMWLAMEGGYFAWSERYRLEQLLNDDEAVSPATRIGIQSDACGLSRASSLRSNYCDDEGRNAERDRLQMARRLLQSDDDAEQDGCDVDGDEDAEQELRALEDALSLVESSSPVNVQPSSPFYDAVSNTSTYPTSSTEGGEVSQDEDAGAPLQYFLNGDAVPVQIRKLLRRMTSAKSDERPTAEDVLQWLGRIGS